MQHLWSAWLSSDIYNGLHQTDIAHLSWETIVNEWNEERPESLMSDK